MAIIDYIDKLIRKRKEKKREKNIKKCNRKITTKPQYIVRLVPSYSNIIKGVCFASTKNQKYYPNTNNLLNKRSELIPKCHQANKYLLCTLNHKQSKVSQRIIGSSRRDVFEDYFP